MDDKLRKGLKVGWACGPAGVGARMGPAPRPGPSSLPHISARPPLRLSAAAAAGHV